MMSRTFIDLLARRLSAILFIGLLVAAFAVYFSQNRLSVSLKGDFAIASNAEMLEKFPTRIGNSDVESKQNDLPIPVPRLMPVVARKCLLERCWGLRFGEHGHDVSFRCEIPEFFRDRPFFRNLSRQLRQEYELAAAEFATPDWSTVLDGFRYPGFSFRNWESSISIDIQTVTDRAVSLLESHSEYTGGANGNFHLVGRNFVEMEDEVHELSLEELFESQLPWKNALLKLCLGDLLHQGASSISEVCVESPEEYGFTIDDLRAFTLSSTGISFFFSPYHVGCYAEGVYAVRIPWSAIRDCLSEESPARLFMAIDSH